MINQKDFYAKDVYPKWKKLVLMASESIDIISPYVDGTVTHLLTSPKVNTLLKRRIYTRIDSETMFDKPYQIKALLICMEMGVEIYSIEELHAKILLIDDIKLSVGSQNFTSRGRKNKEATFMSTSSFINSEFLKTVIDWKVKATKVEKSYLEELNKGLSKFIPKVNSLRKKHQEEFELIQSKHAKERLRILKMKLEEQKEKSLIQFASKEIYLRKRFLNLWTLKADDGYNLTIWKSTEVSITKLDWLHWYPLLNASTGKFIYVRLAATRISFYTTAVTFIKEIKLGSKTYSLRIELPQDEVDQCNIKFVFINKVFDEHYKRIEEESSVRFYFNGEFCELLGVDFFSEEDAKIINSELVEHPELMTNFIQEKFTSVQIEGFNNSITDYLDGLVYKLYIIQYLHNPILVIEKIY